MAATGGAFLSASLEGLVDKFASPEVVGFFKENRRYAESLEQLKTTFAIFHSAVEEAEERGVAETSVRVWIESVEDLVFDAEDMLDAIVTEALRRSLEAKPHQPRILARGFRFTPMKPYSKNVRSKIKAIGERAEILKQRMQVLDLWGIRGKYMGKQMFVEARTTSLVYETGVYGRDADKEAILPLLLSDDASGDDIGVIPIVGMGGIGKTTLAQLVYNDNRVANHFGVRAWVSVSEDFDIVRVTKSVIESATGLIVESNDLNLTQVRLSEVLRGKTILLVLDDVWNENYSAWDMLRTPFRTARRGSKIIVTTRSMKVAEVMSTVQPFRLGLLSDDDCWQLFKRHAFDSQKHSADIELEAIGKEIVKKCKGLPLAAKALGGVLRHKTTEEWVALLTSDMWATFSSDNVVLPALNLSFNHLPANLKRCFGYCSIFPLGYEFEKETLVLLWMAQGFLPQSEDSEMEEVGDAYFHNLLGRSFFQPSSLSESHFAMHDLISELAQFVSGKYCFRLEHDMAYKMSPEVRHLSYIRGDYGTTKNFEVIYGSKCLRTLFSINSHPDRQTCQLNDNVLEDLVKKLQLLRVLSLPYYQMAELPDSIGNLKHLRYLDLSHSELKRLPEAVTTLCYLQTLILTGCLFLAILPQKLVRLISLRHLFLEGTPLHEMPQQMNRLTSLRTLTNFVLGRDGSEIRELGGLLNLHGRLSISGLQNVVTASASASAKLKEMRHLRELHLEWSANNKHPQNEKAVLENLKPSRNLKRLTIAFYGGVIFPDWLGDPSFSNMVSLSLRDCKNCSSLPTFGRLPCLEDLVIERMSGVSSIGHEFYGMEVRPFPSLKRLRFDEMPRWEQWISPENEGGDFPCLLELCIQNCQKLEGTLPKKLPNLLKLEISECQQLEPMIPSVPDACKLLIPDWDIVSLTLKDKLSLRTDDDIVSLSSLHATEISTLTYDVASSSSPDKAVLNVSSQPFAQETEATTQEVGNKVESVLAQERAHHFSSSGSFKISDITQLRDLPTEMQSLRIERCRALESLPIEIFNKSHSLQHLYIIDCSSLNSFPQFNQPSTLKKLYIRKCKKLEFLITPEMRNQFALLEHLCIGSSCDSLVSFPLNFFPKLRVLSLLDCPYLESIIIWPGLLMDSGSLDALEIRDCPNLVSFPKEGLPTPNLTSFILSNCKTLKSLPRWMHNLRSLETLFIDRCPELETLPAGGLPSSLNSICITFCDKITPRKEWMFGRLNSLSHFEIEDGCKEIESFPEEGLLPSNLNSLRISNLRNLKCLNGEELQKLTFLETLEINCCQRLQSLPKEGLPSSLYFLSIKGCSLLKPRLQNETGRDWSKIAHIPHAEIYEEESQYYY